jgi:nucleoside-diphosphate-sugar epimerase
MAGRVFLTGATGVVGHAIALRLVEAGRTVRALVRDPDRATKVLPESVEVVRGDVTDAGSVRRAMEGCSVVYHASGLPEQWFRDPDIFRRVNVEGTVNVLEAALEAKVDKFLYTSTIDVFEMSPGVEFDESRIDMRPKETHYERSKQDADRIVTEALDRGLPARFLHPSGVYGPAPFITPGVNAFVRDLVRGKVPMLLPGGFPVVFTEDVAEGHLLAEGAAVGSRFILSDAYWTLEEFAREVAKLRPEAKTPRVMPMVVAGAVATVGEAVANVIGKPPLIPRGQLHFLSQEVRPSARRAHEELGWAPRELPEGLKATLAFLADRGEI